MPLLPSIPSALTWRILVVLGAYSTILGMKLGFTVDHHSLVTAFAVLATMVTLAHVYTYWRPRAQFAYPTILVAYFVVTGLVLGPMSYFTASLGRPLIDAQLAAIDPLLGFDWLALLRFTAEHPTLALIARIAYLSSPMAIFVVWFALAVTGQIERLSIFLGAFVASAATVIVLAGLFPAAGAYAYFGVGPHDLGGIGNGPGTSYLSDFNALRDGTLRAIDLSKLEGVCQFPSFHTVVALLCAWAVAGTPFARWPMAAFSAFVVYTTMPIGGHHLADVLGGALVAVATVAAISSIERRVRRAAPASADCPGASPAEA